MIAPTIKPIVPAPTIKCQVNGKNLTAEIVAEVMLPIERSYAIRFSDGTEFETFLSDDVNFWIAPENKYIPYIKAVNDELMCFAFVSNKPWFKFEVNDQLYWVGQTEPDEYSIWTKGDYTFHLRKSKSGWHYHTIRFNADPVNPQIANNIARLLEAAL